LERCGLNRRVGHAAGINKGQRPEQAERRDDANKEKRQNRNQRSRITGVNVERQQQRECDSDCDCRNQNPSPPLPILNHCQPSLVLQYISRPVSSRLSRQAPEGDRMKKEFA